jgi:NADPH:quinone reductase-like Zn-dependent oxidoreductase
MVILFLLFDLILMGLFRQSAAKIPDSLEFAQAACVPLAGLTAWESLFECLNLQENERGKSLLVIGGAGGVGSFAIQFAKQKTRLKIIASASSEESRDWCLSLGADHVIDHSKGNFKEGLKNLNLNGVDYILNCFDASIAKQISEVIEPFGKVCMISAGSAINNVDLGFFFFKRVTISFEVVFGRSRFGVDCEKQHLILIEIAKLFEQSKLKIPLRKTLQIFEANEALELISTGHTIGKIALIR